jgi:hypothetical protein
MKTMTKNNAFIGIRIPQAEKDALEEKAIELGLTLTDFIKSCLANDRVGAEPEPTAYPLLTIEYEEDLTILDRFLERFNERQKANFGQPAPTLEILIKTIVSKELIRIGNGPIFETADQEMVDLGKDWKY